MTQLETALQIEIEKLKKENELIRQLSTAEGFFLYYFAQCPKHKTNKDAFNFVNDLYFDFFFKYKYADYHSFKRVLIYNNTKKIK